MSFWTGLGSGLLDFAGSGLGRTAIGAGLGQLAGGDTKSTLTGAGLGLASSMLPQGYGGSESFLPTGGLAEAGGAYSTGVDPVAMNKFAQGGVTMGEAGLATTPTPVSGWGQSIADFGTKYGDTAELFGQGLAGLGNIYSVYQQGEAADEEASRRREFDAYNRLRTDRIEDEQKEEIAKQSQQMQDAFMGSGLASYY